MLIKAAINGGRTKAEHPNVPVSPSEQAEAVLGCLNARVRLIHLHVRSASGVESLDADDLARTLDQVRARAPEASVGVSTGAWIVPDPSERLKSIDAWHVLPDFASVNFSEEGAAEVAECLLSKGVGVEVGMIDRESAVAFAESGLAPRCLRVLLEPQEQNVADALKVVSDMETVLQARAISLSCVMHGTEATTWPLLKIAMARGLGVRIGFEDTLLRMDGAVAESNADLILDALQIAQANAPGG